LQLQSSAVTVGISKSSDIIPWTTDNQEQPKQQTDRNTVELYEQNDHNTAVMHSTDSVLH